MANILIRDVPEEILTCFKKMAKAHNRSLQQELKQVLEKTATFSSTDVFRKASELRTKFRKKAIHFSDSAELLREDRTR